MPGRAVPTEWFRAAPRTSPRARTFSRNAPSVDETRATPTSPVTLSTVPPAAWMAAAASSGVPVNATTYSPAVVSTP